MISRYLGIRLFDSIQSARIIPTGDHKSTTFSTGLILRRTQVAHNDICTYMIPVLSPSQDHGADDTSRVLFRRSRYFHKHKIMVQIALLESYSYMIPVLSSTQDHGANGTPRVIFMYDPGTFINTRSWC